MCGVPPFEQSFIFCSSRNIWTNFHGRCPPPLIYSCAYSHWYLASVKISILLNLHLQVWHSQLSLFLFTFGRDARVEVTGKVEIRDRCLMTWGNNISISFSSWKITKKYEDNYAYFLKIFRAQFLFFIFFIFIPSSPAAITGVSTVKKISS